MAGRLVVEWTRATVRVALAQGRGQRVQLRGLWTEPLGAGADVMAALRSVLKQVKRTAGEVILVVPREQVITRVIKLPATERQELAQMVELYAKAQLPYPREQAVMDFHVLTQQEGFSTVAVVACQREVVDRQLTALREAGVSVTRVTVSSWGVLGWYQALRRPQGPAPAQAEEPTLVVNVDDTRTDLVLIADGRILSSRSVGQGAQEWEPLGQTAELLALEIERSRAAIRKELPGIDVRSLLLTGVPDVGRWQEALTQRAGLPVVTVEGGEPWLARGKSKGLPVAGAVASSVSPVVVGGLAYSPADTLLNLSPPEVRQQTGHRRQVRELTLVSLLLFGVLVLGSSLLGLRMSRQQQLASLLDRALADVGPTAKQLQETSRATRLVASILHERRQVAATLAGVFQTTPSAVALESVTFERARRELLLRGNAASTQEVLDYIKQLEALEGMQEVRLKYSTRRTTPAGERTDFELILRYELSQGKEAVG